ncbi:MAG: FitA-like ribbon-helix-helix domain-containing protein [Solirubrobacteraceae bacterium]
MLVPHLQLKDVPRGLHDALRLRAARAGISMREYVLRLIETDLGRQDTWDEMLAELRAAPGGDSGAPSGAELVRDSRVERAARVLHTG